MPENCCHPVGAHKRLRIPDTYVSSLMLDRALDAISRRVGEIDRKHDIPYLAGYSLDGKRIYIDRHLPKSFVYRGRTIQTDRYLLLHEEVEKTLIDQLGLHYQHAHQIATRAEEAAVRADGVSWRAYDRFMQTYVKEMGDERLTRLPPDLDLKPYRDEHDYDLMRRMDSAAADPKHPAHEETALRRRLDKALATHAAEHEAAMLAAKAAGR
ncbi:MAG: hypothetical protein E7774_08205 [Bradyrhizobium sp.]|nr:MAG: hypothetical protein E7774_08205 [Bradyrhizobium sp.]